MLPERNCKANAAEAQKTDPGKQKIFAAATSARYSGKD
jgi:hypothetical protein